MQTFYDVLSVPMSASQDEIWHAYRRLLVRCHPDRCYHDNDSVAYNTTRELDEVRTNLLSKAYKVLSNPQRRSEYDAYLTRQLRSNSSVYHQPPQQVRRSQGTAQPQVFAFGGGANRSVSRMAGLVKAMMTTAVDGNAAPATAGAAPASGQPISTEEGARRGAVHPQYANPMTRALGTSFGVAGEATATVPEGGANFAKSPSSSTPSSVSIVYTDSVSVRAIKAGPRTVGLVVVTDGGVAPGTPASTETPEAPPQQQQQQQQEQAQPSAAAAAAMPSAVSDVHLPLRIRVIEEHLVL
ncbi:DnaJ domain containing protein, putative [Leishmania donovani]|uniref:DnaJ domain containing protein, putative n=1 Tax=Leishmania donovani TaxID=5661 RepID=A0A3S7WQB1_LEIDO|nr:DnaJ domain containing protein, putative [Leishmania donovani]